MRFFNFLNAKVQAVLVIFLLVTFAFNAFADNHSNSMSFEISEGKTVEITPLQLDLLTEKLENEAEISKNLEEQRLLRKMNQQFASFADALRNKEEIFTKKDKVKKRRITFGEITTKMSLYTNKPFINASGFLTGFFQKPKKDREAYYFLKFFLSNANEFDRLYKDVGTYDEYSSAFEMKMEYLIIYKIGAIVHDAVKEVTDQVLPMEVIYKTIGVEPFASDDSLREIKDSIDMLDINIAKIHPSLINEHPDYKELRPILGDIKMSDVLNLFYGKRSNVTMDEAVIFGDVNPKVYELGFSYFSKLVVPKMVVGIISKSVASFVSTFGVLADIGAVTSTLVCTLNKATVEAIEYDSEIREFCSFVVNQSAYELFKSRSKGFVTGKNTRKRFNRLAKKVKLKFKYKKSKIKDAPI